MNGRLFSDRANHVGDFRDRDGHLPAGPALFVGGSMNVATGFEGAFGALEHRLAGAPLLTNGQTDLLNLG